MKTGTTRVSAKVGLPPGTLVHIGEKRGEKVRIGLIKYSDTGIQEREVDRLDESLMTTEETAVTWINIDGLHQTEIIEKAGEIFHLHPLTLEDIVNTGQSPKIEDYGHYLFIVLKMLYYDESRNEIEVEQVSLCLGSGFLLTFQEEKCRDVFTPVRERIRNGKGRIRKMGPDYLAYSLIDSIVDSYFLILEKLGEKIETLEEDVVTRPSESVLHDVHELKREMIFLRRSIWPLREAISNLQRGESPLIGESMHIYYRDVYDHTIRIIETIEALRDILSGTLDIYLSSISNRTNAVMKVLTIIATIFMPLTFIAGVYGMNFEFMPELKWRWGYPAILSLMLVIGISMVMYFVKKKWF
ncbi:MAG TPA: magnesium/cobalt transporter CorA [Thermodesulfovibrionales bacterium]|nr:magnesium/cobalt transporter CorA [Thermodesulfovibrionales bacterium]